MREGRREREQKSNTPRDLDAILVSSAFFKAFDNILKPKTYVSSCDI